MKTTSIRPSTLHTGLLVLSLLAVPGFALAQQSVAAPVGSVAAPLSEQSFDEALARYFSAERPGATVIVIVIVTRDGKTLFRKAYGLANVDAKVALRPDTTMRIRLD